MTRTRTLVGLPLGVVIASSIFLALALLRTPVVEAPPLPAAQPITQTAPITDRGPAAGTDYGSAAQQPASLAPIAAPVALAPTQAAPASGQ